MSTTFLACFDQFRAIAGILAACFLFCRHAVPRREHFFLRAAAGTALCLAAGLAYVPLESIIARMPTIVYGGSSAAYWVSVTALMGVVIYFCYELPPGEAMGRLLLGCAVESFPTTILRYLVVMMWLPDLPRQHLAWYVLLTAAVYTAVYWSAYYVLAKPMQKGYSVVSETSSLWGYGFITLSFLLIIYATNGICEWVVPSFGDGPAVAFQQVLVRYFCVGIRFLVSTAFIVSLHLTHQASTLRRERDLTNQLLRKKGEQYTLTKENIEFIRRKCHDLKRQLRALEFVGEEERQTVLEKTRRAAEFYDAVVHTGNEALDTLLTEKSIQCANRGIRMSCTVGAKNLGTMSAVDLYTMLSNALDNAIECAGQLSDPEKKTISFSMETRGRMLCIAVENYYEAVIEMRDGYPVTSKADKAEHGIGVRSIHTLARRYGGDIRLSTENQIFLLQIIIPLSREAKAK